MKEINLKEFKNLDEDTQIEYATDLEYEDNAIFKWGLFCDILKDSSISDLTRIEILNILGASDIPKDESRQFINTILNSLENREEDSTYLSHCIMALQNNDLFSLNVYSKMLEFFLNSNEDEDLRTNASIIIDNNTPKDELIEYYKSFIKKKDSLFGERSTEWIKEIQERSH
ncbi:hypothetical protein ACE1MK_13300 [Tenacibaculum maritimum]|uniref:hypothetical protein n=1 Tax=Tenacibaculum maritimum TaxID=107401 RepID=UPI0012E5428A|nr:hypothetical protein [Tenacibaculum maritimum]MCD9583387.1 hypothetical protein [Tenacibaculum maritimum]MCD9637479.1 hypothetical protein [Tenacibaculum maritimum]CAA0156759.1 hypothetical protein USCSP91_100079 [Tenacibaculum maritimum]CAA0255324.1 hypothetical protein USCSE301_780002 [Tenacibaculum maritimum]